MGPTGHSPVCNPGGLEGSSSAPSGPPTPSSWARSDSGNPKGAGFGTAEPAPVPSDPEAAPLAARPRTGEYPSRPRSPPKKCDEVVEPGGGCGGEPAALARVRARTGNSLGPRISVVARVLAMLIERRSGTTRSPLPDQRLSHKLRGSDASRAGTAVAVLRMPTDGAQGSSTMVPAARHTTKGC